MADTKSTAPARKPDIETTVEYDPEGCATRLVLTFADGGVLAVKPGDFSPIVLSQALIHGLKQKLVDAAALSRNPDTGRSATIEDKRLAVSEVYDRLVAGQWNKAKGDGTGANSGGLLFAALTRMYDGRKTADELRAFLAAKTDAEKAALRKNSKVAAVIEELKAERAARGDKTLGGVDSDGLLGELDGE